jgi:hypothetical protein
MLRRRNTFMLQRSTWPEPRIPNIPENRDTTAADITSAGQRFGLDWRSKTFATPRTSVWTTARRGEEMSQQSRDEHLGLTGLSPERWRHRIEELDRQLTRKPQAAKTKLQGAQRRKENPPSR